MALTPEQKKDSYQFFIIAFGAPTGVEYMNQLNDAYGAGMTTKEIVNVYTTKPEFEAQYPRFESNEQFAIKLIENVVGASATAEAKAEAVADVVGSLNAGWTKGDVVFQIFTNLAGKDKADPQWGATAQMLDNKVAVAEYITETLGVNTTDLAQLSALIANVTADVATVEVAKTGAAGANGETLTLTQGLDNIVGTSGNDTINAFAFNSVTGADVTTLNSVDSIDGGAGTDTLNIEVKGDGAGSDYNNAIQGTISNVEIININNTAALSAGAIDATTLGAAAQQIWQIGKAANVTNLAVGTTAGFNGTSSPVSVTAAAAAASASVALANVSDTGSSVAIAGAALNAVNVTGTVVDGVDVGTDVASLAVGVTVGTDVQTVSVNTAVATTLTVADATAATKNVTAVDASASTGAVTYAGLVTDTSATTTYAAQSVKTGAGNDVVSLVTATLAAATGVTAVAGSVSTGAGNDQITVTTTGSGETVVDAGAGDDQVSITGRGTGKLTVNLGEGNDRFSSTVAINGTDVIDAGAGSDTLALSLVGSANIGAFKNFDVYDVKGMAANLDLDILNTNNSVTEIVGSGALGAAVALQNVGAGVNFRATADMVFADNATTDADEVLTLTQKTAGALTVTLDADETGTADAGDDVAGMSVAAAGATSVSAVFDTSYLAAAGAVTGETAATDNVSTIALATQAAASISVVSGGANSKNVLNVTEGAGTDALTTVTVTGAQALTLSVSGASKLATVDASAATGGLTAALADLKDGGTIKLGSGTDVITATGGATGSNAAAGAESLEGFAKTAVVSVSVAAADATAKAAAIAAADKIVIDTDGAGGVNEAVANASISALAATLAKGVLTFTGAGPATLDAALVIADDFAETAGETVAFQYLSNTYLFTQGATHAVGSTAVTNADVLIKLVGVTGVTDLVETGTDTFFIV